jgi:surfeit locus 1 family protein
MPAGYSFRPRLWVLALAALGCAAFVVLGVWQSGRAQQKRELGAALDKRRVALNGAFLPEYTVFLDNKVRQHRAGYEVVTPLRVDGASVLVNRGWIEAPPRRDNLPAVRTPAGTVRVEGIEHPGFPKILTLRGEEKGKVRQTIDLAKFAAETGLNLRPVVLEQHSSLDDGLSRDWPRPDAGIEKHESYALQWYSFAALALTLGVVFSFKRK